MERISIQAADYEAIHTAISNVVINDEEVLRVVKAEKIHEYDENTYAKAQNVMFHNGTIEVDMLSRLLPDAPDFARGFIGIAFRIAEDDRAFESFFPHSRCDRVGQFIHTFLYSLLAYEVFTECNAVPY